MDNSVENVYNSVGVLAKIVVTGGPCAGKSESLKRLPKDLEPLGWKVLVLPETANELITAGIAPWTCSSNKAYHELQMELHAKKEEIFERAAIDLMSHNLASKVLIICDRGLFDPLAYMDPEEFWQILNSEGSQDIYYDEYDYDAVFHLETIAKSYPDLYTLEDSTSRHESVEEAIALDDITYHAWDSYRDTRFLIIGQSDFEDRYKNLLSELSSFLMKNY